MKPVFLGWLSLVILMALSAPAAPPAPPAAPGKTIRDLSGAIPLGVLERSVGPKFYQSLLRSPIHDWAIVRARVAGTRLADARVIQAPDNPAYRAFALKVGNELTLVANHSAGSARRADFALMHLLLYQIADGVMAVSFAYPEVPRGAPPKGLGTVRLSVKTKEGPWTEIRPPEARANKGWSVREPGGRRLRRMDRMPMDVISVTRP